MDSICVEADYQERISNATDHDLEKNMRLLKAFRAICKYSILFLDRDVTAVDDIRKAWPIKIIDTIGV